MATFLKTNGYSDFGRYVYVKEVLRERAPLISRNPVWRGFFGHDNVVWRVDFFYRMPLKNKYKFSVSCLANDMD